MRIHYTLLLVLCMCLVQPAGCKRSDSTAKADMGWVSVYRSGQINECEALLRYSEGNTFLVGLSRSVGVDASKKRWIWQIDPNGRRVSDKEFSFSGIKGSTPRISRIIGSRSRDVLVGYERDWAGDNLYMLKVGETGAVQNAWVSMLTDANASPGIAAVTSDGTLLAGAVNTKSQDAWIMKLDRNGRQVWQRTYDHGKEEEVMSLAVSPTGEIVMGINSGSYDKLGSGQSNVWIVVCDKDGNILAERAFAGRHPSVAISSGGLIGVAYNRLDFPRQDICLDVFDSRLRPAWRLDSIAKDELGLGFARIVAGRSNGFVVACQSSSEPKLIGVSQTGRILWEQNVPLPDGSLMATCDELVALSGGYFLLGQLSYEPDERVDVNSTPSQQRSSDRVDILLAFVRAS